MALFETMSDEQVLAVYIDVTRPPGGREAAFSELVVRYRRRVFAVCVRILGSPADAEDAVQETFIKLARSADGFRGDAKLSTWLYRVAHNVCTDRVRYDARRPATPVEDMTAVADEPDADDQLAARESAMALKSALAQLDERSRTLLLLVAVDELSYAEVAEVVDLPVGTVKSRVSRARVRLGEILAASMSPGPDRGGRTHERPAAAPGSGAGQPFEPRGPPDR